jgi:hypothetical protein
MAIEEASSPVAQQSCRDEEREQLAANGHPKNPYAMMTKQEKDIKGFSLYSTPLSLFSCYTRLIYSLLGLTGQA